MCDVREYFERSMLRAAMKQRITFLRPVDSCAAAPSMAATRVDNLFNNPSEGNLSRLAANAGARGPTSHRLRLQHLAEPVSWNA